MLERDLEQRRVIQELLEDLERPREVQAVAEALVGDEAEAHALFYDDLRAVERGLVLLLADRDEQARRAEFIDVVEDVVDAERPQVRDEERRVERARVDHRLRQRIVPVHEHQRVDDEADQRARDAHDQPGELIRRVRFALLRRFPQDRRVDLFANFLNVLGALKAELDRRAGRVAAQVLVHDEADPDLRPRVDPAAHHEAVELRAQRHKPHERRDHHVQVGDLLALRAPHVYIIIHPRAGDALLEHIHRVCPGAHDVRDNALKRLYLMDLPAVHSFSKHSVLSPRYWFCAHPHLCRMRGFTIYIRSKISRNYWLFEPKCRNNAEITYTQRLQIASYFP